MVALAGSRVVVTGAAGFIGSHLVEELLARGCDDIVAFVRYTSTGTAGWLDQLTTEQRARVRVIHGDIRDPWSVLNATEGAKAIFHLAALISIPYSYVSPDAYVETNVRGTLNVLEAARRHRVERVVITSTSEVYGTARRVPIDEEHPLEGQSPYSASKIGADQLATSFHRSFDVPVTILRPFNCYGPRQSTRAIIPTIISQIAARTGVIRIGSLTPTRDFTFVTDTARAFVAIAQSDAALGKVVNAGSGAEISIGDLVERLQRIASTSYRVEVDTQRLRPEKSEVLRLLADSSLAARLIGWRPETSLDEGLARTLAWFSDPGNLARYPQGYRV